MSFISNSQKINPHRMPERAYYGVLGSIIKKVAPYTEINPESLFLQSLTGVSATLGRSAYLQLSSSRHHLNLFVLLLGETGQGKGEGQSLFKNLLRLGNEEMFGLKIMSGMVSGQGLIDALAQLEQKGSPGNPKTAFIVEEEFASALRAKNNPGSNLGQVLRKAFDNQPLESMGRERNLNLLCAKDYYFSAVCHITPAEYSKEVRGQSDHADGFSNRFLYGKTCGVRNIPSGKEPLSCVDLTAEIEELRAGIEFAKTTTLVQRAPSAEVYWNNIYGNLKDPLSDHASMLARGRVYTMKLAGIFAVLDQSSLIEFHHLEAAYDIWLYSVGVVEEFMARPLDTKFHKLFELVKNDVIASPNGIARAHVTREILGRNHKISDADLIREILEHDGIIRVEIRRNPVGRPTEVWYPIIAAVEVESV